MFVTVDLIQNNWQHFNNLAILDFTRQWNDSTCRWSIICTHLLAVMCSFWRSYRIADTERLFPVKTPTVSFFLAFHSPYWWGGMKWRGPHRQHLREWYDRKPLWWHWGTVSRKDTYCIIFFLAFHSPYWWRGMKWRDPHRQHLREWYDSKPLWYKWEQIIHQQLQPITIKRTLAVSITLWDQINDNRVLILMQMLPDIFTLLFPLNLQMLVVQHPSQDKNWEMEPLFPPVLMLFLNQI